MTTGANGDVMHGLKATQSGRITISLLKTATGNALFNQMYRYQATSSAFWGRNILTIANPVTGDAIVASAGAFVKHTDIGYSAEPGMNVWAFDFGVIAEVLGNGLQNTGI
jgi:gentisate 1,2-dioxygenase